MISVMTDVSLYEVMPMPASRPGMDVRYEDGFGGKIVVSLTMSQAEELALEMLAEVERHQARQSAAEWPRNNL
jgi:hypothetical protein